MSGDPVITGMKPPLTVTARADKRKGGVAKRVVSKHAPKNSASKTHRPVGLAARSRADVRSVVVAPGEIQERVPTVVNVRYAKANLSRLLHRVLRGERLQIAVGNQGPRFGLVTLEAAAPTRGMPRQFGSLRGVVTMDETFLEPLPTQELDAWER